MDVIATIVAAGGLSSETVSNIADAVDLKAIQTYGFVWIDDHAGDFGINAHDHELPRVRAAFEDAIAALGVPVDVFVQPEAARNKRLLIADMDSTMITCECIDELADYAGIKPEIAAITERAMVGELDFAAALAERVALLAGLPESMIEQCLAERVRATPGAKTLVRTLSARGVRTVLVSGGFTRFAEPVGAIIGSDHVVANVLEIESGVVTGRVLPPIIDSAAKLAALQAECAALGIDASQAMAIGDGANDVPMLAGAGFGVAYRGHAAAVTAADASIRHGDLTVLLYAMGIAKLNWAL